MLQAQLDGFYDELRLIQMEKTAIDPFAVAGGAFVAKNAITNALHRFGHKIPAVRKMGQEIAGVGFRSGAKGYKMLHPVTRTVAAIGGDARAVSLYEQAHRAGGAVRNVAMRGGISSQNVPGAAEAMRSYVSPALKQNDIGRFLDGVPLTPGKGIPGAIRRTVDYGLTPVSQVGRDIVGGARTAANAIHNAGRSLYKRPPIGEIPARTKVLDANQLIRNVT